MEKTLTPRICIAARALSGTHQMRLAKVAGLGIQTVRRYEKGDPTVTADTVAKIREALEAVGVQFRAGGWVRVHPEGSEPKRPSPDL